ncbi:unnamed protein product [Ectocarpus fasciculatus]
MLSVLTKGLRYRYITTVREKRPTNLFKFPSLHRHHSRTSGFVYTHGSRILMVHSLSRQTLEIEQSDHFYDLRIHAAKAPFGSLTAVPQVPNPPITDMPAYTGLSTQRAIDCCAQPINLVKHKKKNCPASKACLKALSKPITARRRR